MSRLCTLVCDVSASGTTTFGGECLLRRKMPLELRGVCWLKVVQVHFKVSVIRVHVRGGMCMQILCAKTAWSLMVLSSVLALLLTNNCQLSTTNRCPTGCVQAWHRANCTDWSPT